MPLAGNLSTVQYNGHVGTHCDGTLLGHFGSCGHLNPLLLPFQMGRSSQCYGLEAIYYSRQEACRHFADISGIFLSHMDVLVKHFKPTNKCIIPPSKLNNLATYCETEKPSLKEDFLC